MKTQILTVTFDTATQQLIAEYDGNPLGSEHLVAQVIFEIARQVSPDPSPETVVALCMLIAERAKESIRENAAKVGIHGS